MLSRHSIRGGAVAGCPRRDRCLPDPGTQGFSLPSACPAPDAAAPPLSRLDSPFAYAPLPWERAAPALRGAGR